MPDRESIAKDVCRSGGFRGEGEASEEGDGDGAERIPQIAREGWYLEPQCEMWCQLCRVSVSDRAWWVIGSMHEGRGQFEGRFVFGMV